MRSAGIDLRIAIAICLTALGGAAAADATNGVALSRTGGARGQAIGIEGRAVLALPSPNYQVKPLDDRTELILRIERIERGAGENRYHFHFIGLEPGAYRLADYLIRPDGSRPDEIADVRLPVEALLPVDHNGHLSQFVARPFPFIGGYRVALMGLGVVWLGGLAGLGLVGRKKAKRALVAETLPPSFADRLQPLVEAAARRGLTVEEQAALERLLMGYWRDKLNLAPDRIAQALQQLKAHPEAGAILRTVERWLHAPGDSKEVTSEIRTLLEPYRHLPGVPAPQERKAT